MKLLVEQISDVQYITEERDGKKSLYICGPFLCGERANRNGRIYPMNLLDREVARYQKECIAEHRSFGELSHPNTPTVNLDRVALMVKELRKEGTDYIGKAKITTETPMGAIAKALIDEGAKLGVSSRGVGSLKPDKSGVNYVCDDYRLCVASDLVAEPSGIDCFVSGVMEGMDWQWDEKNGWVQGLVEDTKKELNKLSVKQIEEQRLTIIEQFLNDLVIKKDRYR